MIKKLTFTIFLFTFAFLAAANAQTVASNDKPAAIKELVTLINTDNKAEDFYKIMSAQMEVARAESIKTVLDSRTDLTPADRKMLEDLLIKDAAEREKRFEQKLLQKLDFNAMVNEITVALFDKYYTLEEIRDLTSFYKTPTGQKSLKLMPTLMSDTMIAVQEKLLPKIPVILKELQDEERTEIEKQINEKKPRLDKKVS